MTLRSTRGNPDKPAFKAGRPSTAYIVHDKPQAARTRPSDRLIPCLCDWQDGVCRYEPRPANCRGPHISDRAPGVGARLGRWWRRLMTDEEGL